MYSSYIYSSLAIQARRKYIGIRIYKDPLIIYSSLASRQGQEYVRSKDLYEEFTRLAETRLAQNISNYIKLVELPLKSLNVKVWLS